MNLTDRLIVEADSALKTLFAPVSASRPAKPGFHREQSPLSAPVREESIRLMRVNHCGEVCAQALYQGQAFVARDRETRDMLTRAAREERDHLAWCDQRVRELGGRTSVAAPAFYAGSFALGMLSGGLGDRWSMGFLVETERQVEAHLDGHLERLSPEDPVSRGIVETMREEEIQHGNMAESHGAANLPKPVKGVMSLLSKVMTEITYRV